MSCRTRTLHAGPIAAGGGVRSAGASQGASCTIDSELASSEPLDFQAERDEVGTALWSHVRVVVVVQDCGGGGSAVWAGVSLEGRGPVMVGIQHYIVT